MTDHSLFVDGCRRLDRVELDAVALGAALLAVALGALVGDIEDLASLMEVVDLAAGSRPGDAARSPCCVGAIDLRVAWQLQAAGSWTGLEASPSARMDAASR